MDIAIEQTLDGIFDLDFRLGDFKPDGGLETAILISLFSDRRCEPEEVDPLDDNRRGWWGDLFADFQGDEIGSKLWLLDRSKLDQDFENRAQEYAEDALRWLLDDGVVTDLTVEATIISQVGVQFSIVITKPKLNQQSNFRYQLNWDGQLSRGQS